MPSRKWLKGFKIRHPSLAVRTPEEVTRAAATVTAINISIWFDKITAYLEKKEILQHLNERPENWLNLDESGVDLNTMPHKIITTTAVPHSYSIAAAAHNERVTITLVASAGGFILSPQMILRSNFARSDDVAWASGGMIKFGDCP